MIAADQMMMTMMLKVKDFVRGNLSLPAVVFVWAGLWNILDIDVPGGTGLWKELSLAALGAFVMLWTQTFLSNAGMDAWNADGIIMRLRAAVRRERADKRDRLRLYALSLAAMAGSITFWDGVYTIFEEHVWDASLRFHLICTAVGGVGVVWVWTSEEEHGTAGNCHDGSGGSEDGENQEERKESKRNTVDATVEHSAEIENGNGKGYGNGHGNGGVGNGSVGNGQAGALDMTDAAAAETAVVAASAEPSRVSREAPAGSDPAILPPFQKIVLYAKGFLGNICGVVFWYGLEHVITDQSPDTPWTGLVSYAAGVMLLVFIWRWKENCGLDSDEEREKERGPGEFNEEISVAVRNGQAAWAVEDDVDGLRFCWPAWVTTTFEISGVVAAWTGVEWYIWDDDFIIRTWYRDLLYIVGGLAVLQATGTFLELSGTPLGGVGRRKTEIVTASELLRRFLSTSLSGIRSSDKKQQQLRRQVAPGRPPQQPLVHHKEGFNRGE